jgi:type IV pilus assembly protein PilY1
MNILTFILNVTLNKTNLLIRLAITCLFPFMLLFGSLAHGATPLADSPLFSTNTVPGNVALALSVEFPTALGSAYTATYDINAKYIGYFDADKCYVYTNAINSATASGLFNTGVSSTAALLANGSDDTHWTLFTKPATAGDLNNVNTANALGNSTKAQAIGGNANTPAGSYTYRTTFTIPAGTTLSNVVINFTVAYDNTLSDILVNGTSTRISNNTLSTKGELVTLNKSNSSFVTGANTIDIKINQSSSNTNMGIRVDKVYLTYDANGSYFAPNSVAVAHDCTGKWSGNFLNWALTQTIDPFRYALTGGYRSVDTSNLTILEKAWASGQGGTVATPTSSVKATITKSTPFNNLNNFIFKINGLQNKLYFTSSNVVNFDSGANMIAEGLVPSTATMPANTTNVYEMFARVKVCDSTLLEANCTKYPGGNYKPTGLVQKYSQKLNFAAFGYLNDSNIKRDGGVLRAKMSALGPKISIPNSVDIVNPNAEWDENTGVFPDNPDPTDATATGVTNSGVINYLNKFGLTAPGYKTYDPVGELYYTAIRYFKNLGNVASYTSGLDATKIDGFPVFTTWTDPIKYSCQANFVIGVGDSNTHADANVPGSTIASGNEPAMPAEVTADLTVNARTATNKVGALENVGYGNLGDQYTPWCCSNNTYLMAGLAYDSHTKDIRPDINGKQTIATYWLDVLESGDRFDYGGVGKRNQFWLATKYGGFNNASTALNYDPYSASVTAPTVDQWDADKNGDPDNYYRANNPQNMIDGLNNAFTDIISKVQGSSNAFATVSPLVTTNDLAFATSYNADGWTGNIIGNTVTFVSGLPVATKVWDASTVIGTQNWDTGRYIATSSCGSAAIDGTKTCAGVPFRLANLAASNKTDLSGVNTTQQNILNFLRGDRTNETTAGGLRVRKSVLGDIANSKVIAIGIPSEPYAETFNLGYAAFKTAYASRINMAYVGANDGMLHAINGTNTASGGKELFAYVPSPLFNGPNGTPQVDGLAALANPAFLHHQYVDSTPVVHDANLGTSATPNWRSLLVGGLGKGGKAYYAIDVTDPSILSNETNLKNAVKWEFTHKDMGYSMGKPVIVKINANNGAKAYNGWAVIVTSGYNNTDKNGYFFVLNAATGALLYQIPTYSSAPATDAGLAHVNAFVSNSLDFTADSAYAGDLLGGLWRLDLSKMTAQQIATLKDKNGTTQPVTTPPMIEVDQASNNRYVFVGTGKLLDDSDLGASGNNTFYAINDGISSFGGFLINTTLPTGVTFPINRGNLNDDSSTFTSGGVVAPSTNTVGWYVDLDAGYLINVDMVTNAGIVAFVANNPSGTVCSNASTSNGTSRTYAFSYGKGESAIDNSSGFVESSTLAKHLVFYKDVSGGSSNVPPKLAATDENGNFIDPPKLKDLSALKFKLLNWRDLPTAD